LLPQQATLPSVLIAQLCELPALTAVTAVLDVAD
jgi:hypothetical protein